MSAQQGHVWPTWTNEQIASIWQTWWNKNSEVSHDILTEITIDNFCGIFCDIAVVEENSNMTARTKSNDILCGFAHL